MTPLRVVLDVNIWVANALATARGRQGSAVRKIVAAVTSGRWADNGRPVQLVISHQMLDTLALVLERLGSSVEVTDEYADAVKAIMKFGPEELDPHLLLGGRERFALTDLEDAGVLATAFAASATLLVTDNLKDFETGDALRANTSVVKSTSGSRQLYALRYQVADVDLVIAHPFDVIAWLDERVELDSDALWSQITERGQI
jgi:predicted nucleic acid-binding protein